MLIDEMLCSISAAFLRSADIFPSSLIIYLSSEMSLDLYLASSSEGLPSLDM
jgi:hypothetical protein